MSNKSRAKDWLITVAPILLATVSILFMVVRSFLYANMLPARLDESLFLYKGYLFATGVYKPFEPYGPWTNKNPLAFLIPGWIQQIFGYGLRTGRIASILLGAMTLVAIWIIVKRLTSSKLATLSVALTALNPLYAWTFAQFISQSLTIILLAWTLVFSLGKDRSKWEILFGTILSVLVVQVRQNMLPVPFLLILYIFWQQGVKIGFISLLTGIGAMLATTFPFWPAIIRNYVAVIPDFIKPIIYQYVYFPYGGVDHTSIPGITERILSFTQGIRAHLVEFIGLVISVILSIKQKFSGKHNTTILFLITTYVILFLAHMWAAIFNNYCVFCFTNYLTFFGIIGSILFTLTLHQEVWDSSSTILIVINITLVMFLGLSIGFSIHPDIGHYLLELQVPRVSNLKIAPGTVSLWTLLSNKFGATYDELEILIPSISGILISILLVLITFLIKRFQKSNRSFLFNLLSITLIIWGSFSFFLTEIQYNKDEYRYERNIIQTYEDIGAYLNSKIEPGSKVWYWGVSGQIILGYLEDIYIYPPQLNSIFNYVVGDSGDVLYEHGYWNEEFALAWLNDCDYAIVENTTFSGDIVKWIDPDLFDELAPTITIDDSNTDDYFRIFRRK